jgi:MFS family permease
MNEEPVGHANLARSYVLWVLLVILAFNYTDRFALGLVLEDIKRDLALSDSQLGFMTGLAFAVFYAAMGIPIARWADYGNRVTIIGLTTAVWSAMVALCGASRTFLQLVLIRIGVGIGEAGCIPPAQSLIGDYFSRAELPKALALYMQGATLSVFLGYFVAGWVNEMYGWRAMFLVISAPGVLMAVLARTTLKEPRLEKSRSRPETQIAPATQDRAPMRDVVVTLWRSEPFRHLLFSFALMTFFNYGLLNWQPAYLVRRFGLGTGELGTWLACIYGFSTLIGLYLGGELASRYCANSPKFQLRAMAAVTAGFGGALWAPIYFTHDYRVAFALMALSNLGGTMIFGPMFATMQSIIPTEMRAIAIAIVYLCANLLGMGLGPFAVGALSDALRHSVGDDSLRYALLAMCPGYFWAAWHLWRAGDTINRATALRIQTRLA